MVVALAAISMLSFLSLAAVGARVAIEGWQMRTNRLFALWAFTAALVALAETFARVAESADRASILAVIVSFWPLSSALFFRFCLTVASPQTARHWLVRTAPYALATAMALAFLDHALCGDAVEAMYGYGLTSPVAIEWPSIVVVVGQPVFLVSSLIALIVAARSPDASFGPQEVGWVIAGYASAAVITLTVGLLRTRSDLAVPEMTSLSYLVMVGLIYVAMRKGILRSLIPRSALEASLRASLREKETLLQELHHRVNNSLQLIVSLMHLKSGAITDENAQAVLSAATVRVELIARVYDRAYSSDDLAAIRLDRLIMETAEELWLVCAARDRVRLEYHLDPIDRDVQVAIVIAMIAAELVWNSLTHGYPGPARGKIEIRLSGTPEGSGSGSIGATLAIRDDGCGMAETAADASSGLEIARSLAAQIGGTLSVSTTPARPGVDAALRF